MKVYGTFFLVDKIYHVAMGGEKASIAPMWVDAIPVLSVSPCTPEPKWGVDGPWCYIHFSPDRDRNSIMCLNDATEVLDLIAKARANQPPPEPANTRSLFEQVFGVRGKI